MNEIEMIEEKEKQIKTKRNKKKPIKSNFVKENGEKKKEREID